MIHDEICTYEVCKLAKEKGFPQHITDEAYIVDNYGEDDYNIGDRLPIPLVPDYMDDIAAPTQSLLQRWLREEKGLCISVEAYPTLAINGKICFAWVIKSGSDGHFMESNDSLQTFSTYELALEDALKYALENLAV